jgi:hypothetical protein
MCQRFGQDEELQYNHILAFTFGLGCTNFKKLNWHLKWLELYIELNYT